MMFSSVVLPEPEGPKMATNSLSRSESETSLSACCVNDPVVYDLRIFLTWSMRFFFLKWRRKTCIMCMVCENRAAVYAAWSVVAKLTLRLQTTARRRHAPGTHAGVGARYKPTPAPAAGARSAASRCALPSPRRPHAAGCVQQKRLPLGQREGAKC